MSILIKNGRVVTAVDDYHADVFIDGEKVALIGQTLDIEADEIIDASNRLVIPGGIDPHTHLDMPFGGTNSADDFETGTRAAAHGGTTTILDFAIQTKGQSSLEALDNWHAKAEGKTTIDYGFHMILSDMEKERLGEMRRLSQEGVTSYKMFMAYPGVFYVDDGTIYRAMRQAADDGTLVCMHAENGIVIDEIIKDLQTQGKTGPKYHAQARPTLMEAEGIHRAIAIAETAGAPVYIVHVSSADALREINAARTRGIHAYGETCPQYLFLDDSYYDAEGFEGAKYVMTPPLRHKCNQPHLWRGLKFADLQSIATDHCPFCYKDQKELGRETFTRIPNGAPGVENRMALIYNGGVTEGRIDLNRFVQLTSTNAAKIFGMFPRKGTIAVGSDADVVIFDPDVKQRLSVDNPVTHHMNVDYCTYEGFEVQGYPETVISRGEVVVRGHETTGRKGRGKFIRRGQYSGIVL